MSSQHTVHPLTATFGATPFGATPFGATPFGATPFGATPFAAAVMRDGKLELTSSATPPALFPLYSITKVYVATLILQTIAAGRLDLDTRLARFHPQIPSAGAISIEHLLAHTSGLPDYGALPAYRNAIASGAAPWSFDTFAAHTWGRGILFAPGRGWTYSNPGYALLVDILERVWQRSAAELLRELITEPLALAHTRWATTLDDPAIAPSRSTSLSRDGQPREVKQHYHPGWVWHRLLVSCAADTARFLDVLLRETWLGVPLTRAMTRLRPVAGQHPPWRVPGYGLGLMGEIAEPGRAVHGHSGGGPGYAAAAYHFEDSRCTIVVMAATEDGDGVLRSVLDLHRRLDA